MKREDYVDPPSGPLLTVEELARYLSVSPGTLRGWCNDPQASIPHLRLGDGPKATIRFDPDEIDAWIQERRRPGTAAADR